MTSLSTLLHEKGCVLADGAIGTNLFAKGLETGDAPELWNCDQPDKISELLHEFIEAGADILLTNSFGANRFRLALHQADSRVAELNAAAVRLAKEAAATSDRAILVAGDMGPTGELFAPLGALTKDDAVAAFTEQATALAEAGADLLWIETMSSLEEVEAAIIAANSTGLPVLATMTFDTAGRTMMGITPADFVSHTDALGVAGVGANCGIGPAELLDSILLMAEAKPSQILIAKGNCGIPSYVEGEIHYHGTPDLMADYALCARAAGAQIIGGCCGTTPAHLAAMREALDRHDAAQVMDRDMIEAKIGKGWANLPDNAADSPPKRARTRRRSRSE